MTALSQKRALKLCKHVHRLRLVPKSETKALRKWLKAKNPEPMLQDTPGSWAWDKVILLSLPSPSDRLH